MSGSSDPYPRSVEEIYDDYSRRRSGIHRALTDGAFCRPCAAAAVRPLLQQTIVLQSRRLVKCQLLQLHQLEEGAVHCRHTVWTGQQWCSPILFPHMRNASLHVWEASFPYENSLSPCMFNVTEVDDFYQQCDPDRDNLCLYGELHVKFMAAVRSTRPCVNLVIPLISLMCVVLASPAPSCCSGVTVMACSMEPIVRRRALFIIH